MVICENGVRGLHVYKDAMDTHNIPHDVLSAAEANRRFPDQLNLPDSCVCLLEHEGGVLKASKALATLQVAISPCLLLSPSTFWPHSLPPSSILFLLLLLLLDPPAPVAGIVY